MTEKISFVDLHAHLGSSVSPSLLWDMAHDNGLRLDHKDFFEFEKAMFVDDKMDHKKYLYKFKEVHKIQNSPASITKSVYGAVSNAYRKQNLAILELRFNPMKRNGMNREYDLEAVILSAIIGLKRAYLAFPFIKVGLIIETDREFTAEQSVILAQKAVKFKNDGIVGFDIAGFSPKDFDIANHAEAFKIAKNGGLSITCHTGEVTDAEEVKKFIELLKPDRIGHGIQIWKDKEAMEMVSKKNIVLEVCPTSNIKTGIVKDYYSFGKIFDTLGLNGVKYTINSDGHMFLGSSVKEEFNRLLTFSAINSETMDWCLKNSVNATFIK